jgi:DNA repair protein RecN (Recombination protein N)
MLLELAVTNLVIVDAARLRPGAGLCAITGETGAGKSLLMDAVELLRGARAAAGLVGPHADHAEVIAVVQAPADLAARTAQAAGVAADDGQFILRRRLTAAGRSQAWINDTPVTVATLRGVADALIEVHAQHAALRLGEPAVQLALLDRHACLAGQAEAYAAAHAAVLAAAGRVRELAEGGSGSAKELDFLRFQEREFAELDPKAGELAELEARHALLADAGTWRDAAGEQAQALEQALAAVGRAAKRLADAPEPRLAEAGDLARQAQELLRDAARACRGAEERLHADPEELDRTAARLDQWHTLARKHAPGAADVEAAVLAARAEIQARIHDLSTVDERLAQARSDLAAAEAERLRLGTALAKARAKAFPALAEAVQGVLADLGMPKARLLLHQSDAPPGPLGSVHQEIHLRTNPGLPAGPIGQVASGGEAARLVLACAAVGGGGAPVLVFDEIDAGVGARLGGALASVLARLAEGRTVVAVTHTAQIAASAAHHYRVAKDQADDRTRVQVEALAGAPRQAELVAMLGGGAAAQAQARELLAAGGRP